MGTIRRVEGFYYSAYNSIFLSQIIPKAMVSETCKNYFSFEYRLDCIRMFLNYVPLTHALLTLGLNEAV